jgi:hypothetical protein
MKHKKAPIVQHCCAARFRQRLPGGAPVPGRSNLHKRTRGAEMQSCGAAESEPKSEHKFNRRDATDAEKKNLDRKI